MPKLVFATSNAHKTEEVAYGGAVLHITHGSVEGRLISEEQGVGGFGYDPLFIPDGFSDTFGLLPAETKNQLSHRARALAAMKETLATLA
jgi:XTP/dITP diphosphohydrolase